MVDIMVDGPLIGEITVDREQPCIQPFHVSITSQCPIQKYEWHAFDLESNQEIPNFFMGNTNSATVTPNLSNSIFNAHTSGSIVKVRVQVITRDQNDITADFIDIISLLVPLRIDLPSEIYRCPGGITKFTASSIATGGIEPYQYTWNSNSLMGENPEFTAPLQGSDMYAVTVVDNQGCSSSASITVTARGLINEFLNPQNFACSDGISEKKIGPLTLDLGGSGQYEFTWVPDTYLDEKYLANPSITGIPTGQTINYTLTIKDIHSGCTASDNVSISGLANDLSVDASTPVSICYGDGTKLLRAQGAPAPTGWAGIAYRYKWTSNHRNHAGIENESGNTLLIPEMAAKYPGNYVYTVRYSNQLTGCYVEKDINLTIREQWKHTGYVPEVKSAVVGQEVDLWSKFVTNTITSSTPNKNNITVTWSPVQPNNITTIDLLPKNGKFAPATSNHQLTMKVVDNATGCNKEYKSSRYILSYKKPELFVTPHNFGICEGSKLCLDIKFDAHLANYSTSLLPDYITVKVNVAFDKQNSANKEVRSIPLKLVNSAGLYAGQMCTEKNMGRDGLSGFVQYGVEVGLQSTIWENIGDVISFIVYPSSSHRNISTCFGNAPDELSGFKMDFGVNCSTPGTHFRDNPGLDFRAGSYINIATPGKGIALVYTTNSHPHPNFNEGPSLEILPCISEIPQAPELGPSENEETAARAGVDSPRFVLTSVGFEVVPNPFSQIARITYVIPPQCYGDVEVNIRDFTGRLIKTIEKRQPILPGTYQTSFDGSALPPGMYLYELLVCNGQRIVKKVEKINH